MKQRFNDIALLGKLDDMLALEGQHDDQLCNNICQLRNTCLIKLEEVVKHVDIDED